MTTSFACINYDKTSLLHRLTARAKDGRNQCLRFKIDVLGVSQNTWMTSRVLHRMLPLIGARWPPVRRSMEYIIHQLAACSACCLNKSAWRRQMLGWIRFVKRARNLNITYSRNLYCSGVPCIKFVFVVDRTLVIVWIIEFMQKIRLRIQGGPAKSAPPTEWSEFVIKYAN